MIAVKLYLIPSLNQSAIFVGPAFGGIDFLNHAVTCVAASISSLI